MGRAGEPCLLAAMVSAVNRVGGGEEGGFGVISWTRKGPLFRNGSFFWNVVDALELLGYTGGKSFRFSGKRNIF